VPHRPRPDTADPDDETPATAVVVMTTGERYEVEGSPKDVEAAIVAASRGSILQLAWMTEADSGRSIAINPLHVAVLESGMSG
jgi:hypothetical protein